MDPVGARYVRSVPSAAATECLAVCKHMLPDLHMLLYGDDLRGKVRLCIAAPQT